MLKGRERGEEGKGEGERREGHRERERGEGERREDGGKTGGERVCNRLRVILEGDNMGRFVEKRIVKGAEWWAKWHG